MSDDASTNDLAGAKVQIFSRDGSLLMEVPGLDLAGADLSRSPLGRANLSQFVMTGANLVQSCLHGADLTGATLDGANLARADLRKAILTDASLTGADLTNADLRGADLTCAYLRGANLTGVLFDAEDAVYRPAVLREANLSGVRGLLDPAAWMESNFGRRDDGYVVYKLIGPDTPYAAASPWNRDELAPGQYLEEVCNQDRTVTCGCGVNFGTSDLILRHYPHLFGPRPGVPPIRGDYVVWECRLEWRDLVGTCVPYNTDGKARCHRLRLVRPFTTVEFAAGLYEFPI